MLFFFFVFSHDWFYHIVVRVWKVLIALLYHTLVSLSVLFKLNVLAIKIKI